MDWKDITVRMFQQVDEINTRELPDIDKVLFSACVFFNKTEYEIDNERPENVLKMMNSIQRVFERPFNIIPVSRIGKYFVEYDISKITFGQYIELSFFLANGPIKNVHYILATMSKKWMRPHKTSEHRKKANYFLSQPVDKAMSALKAIQESYVRFNDEYKSLFGIDPDVAGNVQHEEFNKRHGWIFSATQVKEHEGITLDEAFALPIRRALNALAYLKAKGKYEVEQLRRNKPLHNV